MFKHILVSTDGSKLSGKAIRAAVRLAAATGAKLTGCYVVAPYVAPMYGEAAIYVPAVSPKRYKELTGREARTAGVEYRGASLTAGNPWEGIIRAAKARKCDLIVMASHGRRGLAGLVLGSETTKVLTHSKIPVLVCR